MSMYVCTYVAPMPFTHPPIQLPHQLADDEQLLDKSEESQINHSYNININLLSEAEIWELLKYVSPKIKVEWKRLAYCMRYKVEAVEAFNTEAKDLDSCCEKLLTNWIRSNHGPEPKTYRTLLKHIKEIDNLTAVFEEIKEQLIQG